MRNVGKRRSSSLKMALGCCLPKAAAPGSLQPGNEDTRHDTRKVGAEPVTLHSAPTAEWEKDN